MTLRYFAHGGGVQSTAALVLSAQGKIDFPVHLFSNVGDDSEHPDTLRYVHEISQPWATSHGIQLIELHKVRRDGTQETLRGHIERLEGRSMTIPVYMGDGAVPSRRACTVDYKIRVMHKWAKAHGASKLDPAIAGIGISVDEIERAHRGKDEAIEQRVYPLLDLGLRRSDCHNIITQAGLPTPPKSSCYFCPFHRIQTWREMRRDRPDLFEQAAQLEDILNSGRAQRGQDIVRLTSAHVPLREISEAQATLFDDPEPEGPPTCDEGVCFI